MAPELLNGQATYSLTALKKVDIYAAALVMWEVRLLNDRLSSLIMVSNHSQRRKEAVDRRSLTRIHFLAKPIPVTP